MSAQLHKLPRRPRPGLGAYPHEVGVKPVSINISDVDDKLLEDIFADLEKDQLAPSRGLVNAVLFSVPCFLAIAIGAMLALWL